MAFYSSLTVLILRFKPKIKIVKILPFLYMVISAFILYIIIPFNLYFSKYTISDVNSSFMRYSGQIYLWDFFVSKKPIVDFLFGSGFIQNDRNIIPNLRLELTAIDSSFLAIIIYQGLISLLIYLVIYFYFWKKFISMFNLNRNYILAVSISLLSIMLASGIFNTFMYGDHLHLLIIFTAYYFYK